MAYVVCENCKPLEHGAGRWAGAFERNEVHGLRGRPPIPDPTPEHLDVSVAKRIERRADRAGEAGLLAAP